MSAFDKQIAELMEENRELETKRGELKNKYDKTNSEMVKLRNNNAYKERSKLKNRRKVLLILAIISAVAGVIAGLIVNKLIIIAGVAVAIGLVVLSMLKNSDIKKYTEELKEVDEKLSALGSESYAYYSEMNRAKDSIDRNERKVKELNERKALEGYLKTHGKNFVYIRVNDKQYGKHWVFLDDQDFGPCSKPCAIYEMNPGVHNIKICYRLGDSFYQTKLTTFRVDGQSKMFTYNWKDYPCGFELKQHDDLYEFMGENYIHLYDLERM